MNDKKSLCNKQEKFYPRYGKFSMKMYNDWTYGMLIFLSISIIRKRIDIGNIIFACFLMFLQCFLIHSEWFRIENDSIKVKKIFRRKAITLPNDFNLIIAEASVLKWPYKRFDSYNKMISLINRYMVCIVSKASERETIQILNWNNYSKKDRYSNVFIQQLYSENFYNDFIYSFVYEKKQFEKLIQNRSCQIFVPKSLKKKTNFLENCDPIYFDEDE